MREKYIRKIKSSSGETITETLVSVLIIVLAMTMLAGSIVSAAKVNRKVKDYNTAFQSDDITASGGNTVSISHSGASATTISGVTVSETNDDNKYVYYD